jgi:hypothetical protein
MKIVTPASFVPTAPAFSSRSIAAPKVVPLSAVPTIVKVMSMSCTNCVVALPEPPWTPICADPLSAISAEAMPAVATSAVVVRMSFFISFSPLDRGKTASNQAFSQCSRIAVGRTLPQSRNRAAPDPGSYSAEQVAVSWS